MPVLTTAKPKYQILPCTQEHVDALKGRLRQGDIDEITASTGRDPDEALQASFESTHECWSGWTGDRVICVFGAASLSRMAYTGVPWLLGSRELRYAGLEVGKQARYYVRKMRSQFYRLENYIDARQKISVKFLQWCGFTMEEPEPYGVLEMPFHKFWMDR